MRFTHFGCQEEISGAVLQMSGEHDSFIPDGDKNPRINKEASKEAQPFPEDRG